MEFEWQGAVVDDRGGAGPPEPDSWERVEVPGRPASLAGADQVAYRTRFADPRDADVERGLLTIEGVYASATVYLNGQQLVRGDWASPIRAPFSPMAENELVVVCTAPEDRFGGIEDTDAVPARARVPSIRGDVSVEAVPSVYVHDLTVMGDTSGEESTIELSALIDAAEPIDDRLTLTLRPEGFRGGGTMERVEVTAEAGERVRAEGSLQIGDERRWWPAELGDQPRYTVRAKLGGYERSATTGLVDVERDRGDLLLNGHRHRPRGVTVPPTADPDDVVEQAQAANATLVRARSHVPPKRLAEACDEAGLLYWQDLPIVGPGDIDVERGSNVARALAASRGNHPSLVCWGVHDDPVDPFGSAIGSGLLDKMKFRWRAWRSSYDAAGAEAVSGSLPSDAVVFPITGPPGTDADAVHAYPGWRYLADTDVEWLLEQYPEVGDVVGSFGAGSLSRPGDGNAAGIDRDALSAGGRDDPAVSQREQARTVRTVLDALRREGVGTIVLDSLVDADVAGGMGVLTAEGERKTAFQSVASGFQPLQAVLDGPPVGGSVGITVCNDTGTERTGELAWTAGGQTGATDVSVGAFDRADGGAVSVPDRADRLTLEYRLDEGTVTNSYDLSIW
ncbi:glycoside hydrolase family 2 [Salinarchaeum laminariae]|uniref:glycoside hydrolase family 2 n=1 Tax=Salinarchaeum laminariae TaxID=869888 RepID=UPI0020BD4DD6|nr:glycoside hydrolase family 2 [Salinarchaeum laminariae]